MTTKPVIAVVGAGSLGVALANLLGLNGYRILLGSRNPSASSQKLNRLFASQAKKFELLTPTQAVSQSDINLLTIPDKQISKVCDELLPHFRRGCCVAHCAGSLDSTELASAK
ncbi:MAG: NAD(P)-binding domain-containing protein, partial [Arenicella sp.]|nr:NAD(P)-binding domain-containing protein [Arenicella sp.]